MKTLWPVVLLILAGIAPHAHAALVVNGSFESPGFATPPYYRYLSDGDTSITGWTVGNDGIGEPPYWMNINGGPNSGGNYPVHDGFYAVAMNQGSSIGTTFPVVDGVMYDLSFWAMASSLLPPDPLRVDVAGVSTFFSDPNGPASGIFTQFHFIFTATTTDPAALLMFSNTSPVGDYKMYALDDVSITAVVPAPSAVLLLATGLVAFLSYGRQWKRA